MCLLSFVDSLESPSYCCYQRKLSFPGVHSNKACLKVVRFPPSFWPCTLAAWTRRCESVCSPKRSWCVSWMTWCSLRPIFIGVMHISTFFSVDSPSWDWLLLHRKRIPIYQILTGIRCVAMRVSCWLIHGSNIPWKSKNWFKIRIFFKIFPKKPKVLIWFLVGLFLRHAHRIVVRLAFRSAASPPESGPSTLFRL